LPKRFAALNTYAPARAPPACRSWRYSNRHSAAFVLGRLLRLYLPSYPRTLPAPLSGLSSWAHGISHISRLVAHALSHTHLPLRALQDQTFGRGVTDDMGCSPIRVWFRGGALPCVYIAPTLPRWLKGRVPFLPAPFTTTVPHGPPHYPTTRHTPPTRTTPYPTPTPHCTLPPAVMALLPANVPADLTRPTPATPPLFWVVNRHVGWTHGYLMNELHTHGASPPSARACLKRQEGRTTYQLQAAPLLYRLVCTWPRSPDGALFTC